MLISCPDCAASYEVEPEWLGSDGRLVRCSVCQAEWVAIAPARYEQLLLPEIASPEIAVGGPVDLDNGVQPILVAEAVPPPPALAPVVPAARQARFRIAIPGWSAFAIALIAIDALVLGLRQEIVRIAPQTASLYAAIGLPVNLRGIVFNDVSTIAETQNGQSVLAVRGSFANVSTRAVAVPRLRFAVRNEYGHEIYSWTAQPPKTRLGPGESLDFRSRLATPPNASRDVAVRFVTRHDAVTGI